MTKKLGKFIGMKYSEDKDSDKVIEIKKNWNQFVKFFWIIFVLKILTKGIVPELDDVLLILLVQSIPVLLMVFTMGYFAHKITKRKIGLFAGLFGFFWFAIVGIFIGYLYLSMLRSREIKKEIIKND
ncbi:hypothetical protein M0Q39_05000 [Patescibacteria group bacterium]|jgi:hypothetical protein|nr:hypothetical protein [Patescibacteria group bacterium]